MWRGRWRETWIQTPARRVTRAAAAGAEVQGPAGQQPACSCGRLGRGPGDTTASPEVVVRPPGACVPRPPSPAPRNRQGSRRGPETLLATCVLCHRLRSVWSALRHTRARPRQVFAARWQEPLPGLGPLRPPSEAVRAASSAGRCGAACGPCTGPRLVPAPLPPAGRGPLPPAGVDERALRPRVPGRGLASGA